MRSGERIPPQELDRIMKLARSHRTAAPEEEGKVGEEISWREVMLGRKKDARAEVEEERRKRAEEGGGRERKGQRERNRNRQLTSARA